MKKVLVRCHSSGCPKYKMSHLVYTRIQLKFTGKHFYMLVQTLNKCQFQDIYKGVQLNWQSTQSKTIYWRQPKLMGVPPYQRNQFSKSIL